LQRSCSKDLKGKKSNIKYIISLLQLRFNAKCNIGKSFINTKFLSIKIIDIKIIRKNNADQNDISNKLLLSILSFATNPAISYLPLEIGVKIVTVAMIIENIPNDSGVYILVRKGEIIIVIICAIILPVRRVLTLVANSL
jgi:hypothetical protein